MRLFDYLKQTRTTQQSFARRIGRSVATVSRIANGVQNTDLQTILAIERATDGAVTAADLVTEHSSARDAA